MRRREVIAAIGTAAAWPLAGRAQESDRVRRIGLLVGLSADDPGMKPRLAALRQELEGLGWVEGRNVRVERRYAPGGGAPGRRSWQRNSSHCSRMSSSRIRCQSLRL
jgi:putative ABC transport system substrate-binding protein